MSYDNKAPPSLHPDAIIRYDETWQVSICRKCGIGVHGNALNRHLRGKRHGCHKHDWGPILNALKDRPQPMSTNDFPRPPNGIAPILDIKVWDGFVCDLCGYIITSRDVMHWKHRKEHDDVIGRKDIFYHLAKVQVCHSSL